MAKTRSQRDKSSFNAFLNPDSTTPYYNRWSYDKNYLNILFNKRVALQNSELNEMASITQSQLGNIASYFVKNGSRVYQAQIKYNTDENYFIADISDVALLDQLIGQDVIGETSGTVIRIIAYEKITSIQAYIYFSYLSEEFDDGETFKNSDESITFQHVSGSTDNCLTALNESGQIYINGYFINVPSTTLKIKGSDWRNKTISVCYFITQHFITHEDDYTLLEPNFKTQNYNAIGADRFKIEGSLFYYDMNDPSVPDNIKNACFGGIIIDNGILISDDESDYSKERTAFIDVLAKRTYNESGNYSVHPWAIYLKENIDDESKYIINIQPGDGYIKGYYVKSLVSKDIINDKSRTTIFKANQETQASKGVTFVYGNYDPATLTLDATFLPDFVNNQEVECMSQKNGQGTVLGKCNIIGYEKTKTDFFIILNNIDEISLLIPSIKSLKTSTGYINLRQNVETNLTEYAGSPNPQVVLIDYDMIESLSNLSYTMQYQITKTSSSDVFTLDSEVVGIIDAQDSSGKHLNLQDIEQNGTSWTVPGAGSNTYDLIVNYKFENVIPRKKTLTEFSETLTIAPDQDVFNFTKEDIAEIVSVIQTTNLKDVSDNDVTKYITLHTGQTNFFYEEGWASGFNQKILNNFKVTPNASTTYTITYKYYEHEAGIQTSFTVDSYPDFGKIPIFFSNMTGIKYPLRSCIDFRIKKSEIGLQPFLFPNPNSQILYDAEVYLPRNDYVYVDVNGRFNIAKGIPSLNPEFPEIPNNAMKIAKLSNRGYGNTLDDIAIGIINTQRFTMEDIGKIDTSVENISYAVAQQQLHNETVKMNVVDTQERDCYKTGIFTDSFINYDNSDWKNTEWYACIDALEQSITSPYNAEHRNFTLNPTMSSNVESYKYVTTIKPIGTKVAIQNSTVTEYINVVRQMFVAWIGVIEMTPSIDTWVEDLGNFIEENYTETSQPPTKVNSWANTSTSVSGRTTTTTITTTTQTTTYEQGDFELSSSSMQAYSRKSEYMREIEIGYRAEGMRPGTEMYYAFFDQTDILSIMSNIVVDSNGVLEGTFKIPANQPTGLVNIFFGDYAETTWATGYFQAIGTQVWTITTNEYIRTWIESVNTTSTSSSTSRTSSSSRGINRNNGNNRGGNDPTAQSFMIGDVPIMLESIDLYFYSKDKNVWLEVYIVEMENGYPSTKIIPGSSVILHPNKINISPDASKATNFKFANPVYLNANTEYAFIVYTTSYDYNIFISKLGQPDLRTGQGVFEQPYTGTFFNSQNKRTWTVDQSRDVTFTLYQYVYPENTKAIAIYGVNENDTNFDVANATLVANTYNTDLTSVKFEYKWIDEAAWTEYSNMNLTKMPTLHEIRKADPNASQKSFQIKLTLETKSSSVSPQIDNEQIYGIFTNNAVKLNDDPDFPFHTATYISSNNKIKYNSQDIKVYLDGILPNRSKIDVSFKMDEFSPSYITQSVFGYFGTDTSFDHNALKNQVCQLYYYNNDFKRLEPKTQLIFTGYDYITRKIYLRSVGIIDDFKNIVVETETESLYEDLFNEYIAIVILPIFSTENIPLDEYVDLDTHYEPGEYVYYNKYIWKKLTQDDTHPSEYTDTWERITTIKTSSSIRQDPNTEWRKMELLPNTAITPDVANENWVEYTYLPQIALEKEFSNFTIRLDMYSKDEINIPRAKNLRGIAMRETNSPYTE